MYVQVIASGNSNSGQILGRITQSGQNVRTPNCKQPIEVELHALACVLTTVLCRALMMCMGWSMGRTLTVVGWPGKCLLVQELTPLSSLNHTAPV